MRARTRDERGRTRSAGDERGGTSVVRDERGDERGGTSAVAMAMTCTNTRHTSVASKRSAWRACGSTSDCVHTFGLEEPPSAEIGRRRTSKALGCHAATPAMLSPETENCWCKLPVRHPAATQLRCK